MPLRTCEPGILMTVKNRIWWKLWVGGEPFPNAAAAEESSPELGTTKLLVGGGGVGERGRGRQKQQDQLKSRAQKPRCCASHQGHRHGKSPCF